jgi:hypothetical protein
VGHNWPGAAPANKKTAAPVLVTVAGRIGATAKIVKVKLEIFECSIERKQRIRPLELLPITATSGFD